MSIINILGGTLLLAFGRKFFWFFITATGFYAGYELALRCLNNKPEWVVLLVALVVGVLGALLIYFFEKLAIVQPASLQVRTSLPVWYPIWRPKSKIGIG